MTHSKTGIDCFELNQMVKPLEQWFLENARVLPWREEPLPYYVWISEIMLQQTRVEAVKPYFDRFIRKLGDVESLANATEEEYLKLWEGLGYYNRVRNLHAAAVQIMEEYGGVIPDDYQELLKLKGIGSYTAGAISSIAYGKPEPAVDGNVLRVISRLTGDTSDIMKPQVKKHMEDKLRTVMRETNCNPSTLNQALMELGAMVCVPNGAPHCEECPWQELCVAKSEQLIDQIPVKTKAKKRRIENRTIFIIRQGDTVAIQKRPNKGLLAGLYELPGAEGSLSEQEALEWVKEQGYGPLYIKKLPDSKHIFSHIEWHMTGYLIKIEDTEIKKAPEKHVFVDAVTATEKYAIPSAFLAYASYFKKIDE